jgi:hypothetical protein
MGFGASNDLEHQGIIEIKIGAEDRIAAQPLLDTDFGDGMAYSFEISSHIYSISIQLA